MKKRRIIIIVAALIFVITALAASALLLFLRGNNGAECDGISHAWGEWASVKDATCTESGTRERICRLCGENETRDIPTLSHILSDWTDNGRGEYIKTCTLCGENVASEKIYTEYSKALKFTREPRADHYVVSGIGGCKDSVVVIPSEVNGMPVTGVDAKAFDNCKSIEAVILPDTVTEIGNAAFCNSSVERVFIPDTVTKIGISAFSGCKKLSSLILPNSLTSLGSRCFGGTRALTSVILPQSLTKLPAYCFGNSSIVSIKVHSGITVIEHSTFEDCTDLMTVCLPDSLTEIEYDAFSGCSALKDIFLPDSICTIGESVFADCISLASVSIPSRVSYISAHAFENCCALGSIYIPAELSSIHETAFLGIDHANAVFLISPENESFYTIGTSLIKRDPTSVKLGNKIVKGSPDTVIIGSADGSIPNDPRITRLGGCAFRDRQDLTEIVIPKNITSIGGGAFLGCRRLVSITYEGTVAEWEQVTLGIKWYSGYSVATVKCSDGDVKIIFD